MEVEDIMILEGYLTWDDVYGEGSAIIDKRFLKLDRYKKGELKSLVDCVIHEYWEYHHLIPVNEDLKKLKEQILMTFAQDYKVRIKDDKDFRFYLQNQVITVINRILKKERIVNSIAPKSECVDKELPFNGDPF